MNETDGIFKELEITPVRIDLPFRLNHVNVFMAEGEEGWKILDTGLHDERTEAKWDELLDGKKVSDLLISHYHPDHFGCAGYLQRKTGARVSMSEIDADSGIHVWEEDFILKIRQNYVLAGVPEETAVQMTSNTKEFTSKVTPYPKIDHYFKEGDLVQFGRYSYEVLFAPGHSDGLVVLYCKEKNILLSTDHILPKITPNIAYWFHGIENPLAVYMESLKKIRKLDIDFVIPCHGRPFHNANERIDEILEHHRKRVESTLYNIGKGSDIYSVCRRLFNKPLNIHETRFALGETIAHLEYLRHRGEVKREMGDTCWLYKRIE
ncbi:MAG TPA: MBL fold metallo-hydrolase [Bacillales bacterium]|nr:MBL fold metallo-hydrolase [Bacillales bacterium]